MKRRRKPEENSPYRHNATKTPFLRVANGSHTESLTLGYTRLFNGITDALKMLQYGNCDAAIQLLQEAQRKRKNPLSNSVAL